MTPPLHFQEILRSWYNREASMKQRRFVMFSYVAIFGFLGFILYASTFAYSVLQKTGDWKKNGIRMMISLIIMVIGFIGIQFS
jgi:uncharacterized BrkB/YihY/UPF0761 family membrane protein